jgi:glucose-6-phosphate isomerase
MIDLASTAGIPVTVDPASGALRLSRRLEVEEVAVRTLDAARDVYERPPAAAPPLYHMANGITPRGHAEPGSALRYELTSLRPGLVGGEWVKTVGHLHDAAPDGVGYPEAYEVVAGEAVFVLFRPEPLTCALVEARTGDRFVIPPGWHHLAVNAGAGAMVFADVVARAVVPDYTLLRERRGGPVYLGPGGIRPNPRYEACRALRLRAADVPAPAGHGRLADTFFGDRRRLDYLLEPARYGDAWRAFEALVS